MVNKQNLNKSALIDTSFLISIFINNDISINKTHYILNDIQKFNKLYITNLIYIETATILSQRLGKSQFIRAEEELETLNLTEIFVNNSIDSTVRKLFRNTKQKDISYVDLATAYIAKEKSISHVISYDKHFKYLSIQFKFGLLGV